ncbi:MAG: ketoacyl-ACP synthase III [Myxococcota bacterium]
MGARITGTGSYLPTTVVGNDAFEGPQFRLRKGSDRRHHASPEETSVVMGSTAGSRALRAAGVDPGDVDLLLCFSGMPDYQYPKDANLLLDRIGLSNATTWSIDTACASFISALACAHSVIEAGLHRRVLVVMVMSWVHRGIDPHTDYSSLGDGAAAVVVEADETGSLVGVLERNDPGAFDFVRLRSPFATGNEEHFEFSHDPRYREYFGVTVLEPVRQLLQRTDTAPEQIDWFLPHQVGLTLQQLWADALGIGRDRGLTTFPTTGNMSAVNIPMILDHHLQPGTAKIQRGDLMLLFAPGAGMHLSAMLWRL